MRKRKGTWGNNAKRLGFCLKKEKDALDHLRRCVGPTVGPSRRLGCRTGEVHKIPLLARGNRTKGIQTMRILLTRDIAGVDGKTRGTVQRWIDMSGSGVRERRGRAARQRARQRAAMG